MRRRDLIALLGAVAVWPVEASAQQPTKPYRVVILDASRKVVDISEVNPEWAPFFRELQRLGYVEGGNLVVERRSAEGRPDRYVEVIREVIALSPDLIVSNGSALALQLKSATQTIPIITFVGDPVALGLAASMARPGGNITGFSVETGGFTIFGKVLEILRSINPSMAKAALLAHRSQWDMPFVDVLVSAARRLTIDIVREPLESFEDGEFRRVIAAFVSDGVQGVIVSAAAELYTNRRRFIDLLNDARLPAIYPFDVYVREGGLICYTSDLLDVPRLMAQYVDRILKGANPAGMPFMQPTKFRTVINLKTANALGVEIPVTLMAVADEVIE